jgi:hypothetical protein
MKKLASLVLSASVMTVILAPPAAAANGTQCVGVLPPGAHDNVVVPSGADCVIADTVIVGNLKIEKGAGVVEIRNTRIHGSLQGEEFDSLDLHSSAVAGSVQVKRQATRVQICNSTVWGDLQVEGGMGGLIEIGNTPLCAGNTIMTGNIELVKNVVTVRSRIEVNVVRQGSIQVFENLGQIDILGNEILRGNLQCEKNFPLPTGGGNVAKQMEGECATL